MVFGPVDRKYLSSVLFEMVANVTETISDFLWAVLHS